ncbi:unnamed protein product [Natator depressus]
MELNAGVGLGLGCSLPCGCQSCPHVWMNRGYAHSRPLTPAPFTDAELPVTKAYSPALDLGVPGGVARVLGAHRVSADITASTGRFYVPAAQIRQDCGIWCLSVLQTTDPCL